jgi:alpha-L-fucosidase
MKKTILVLLACFIFGNMRAEEKIALPNEKQIEWANDEIGVMFHYDLVTYKPKNNWRDWDKEDPSPKLFNPKHLDTDQWIKASKEAGAKYAVLVAKHCIGFSLWPTKAHDYSVASSPWKNGKGDLVRDFINSCKKYGVKPGIYASTTANGYFNVNNPGKVVNGNEEDQKAYNKVVETQLTELWSNYGELYEIWFDGGILPVEKGGADIVPILKKHQPNAIVFQGPFEFNNLIRWVGNEEGVAPEPCWASADSTTQSDGITRIKGLHGNPDSKFWCPGEADVPIRKNNSFQGGWFWHKDQDHTLRNMEEMMDIYNKSVGRNSNLLMGIVVNTDGLVPEADVKLMQNFGKEINKRFQKPLAQTRGTNSNFELNLENKSKLHDIVIEEEIRFGERVRNYTVEGFNGKNWVTIFKGQNIGHKRVIPVEDIEISKVRLIISESVGVPVIKSFEVF